MLAWSANTGNVFDVLELMTVRGCPVVVVMQSLKEDGKSKCSREAKCGKYIGSIDHLSLISWLVRCCPQNFLDVSDSMRKLKNKRIKGQTIVDSQEMMFNIAMLSTMQNSLHKDRIRDDVSAEELKRCQEVGIEFATATIRHVLTELQREDQKQGFFPS